jgi:hypothetical protein
MVRVCAFVIFFLPIIASSQNRTDGKLHSYFTLYCQAEGKLAPPYEPFHEFVHKLETRRGSVKSDKAFIHHLFVKAHQRFFREFQEYTTFADLVSKGNYNCLSGTALFTLLLDHFAIDHHIIETNHHIFILAQTNEGPVLLETTDIANGFVNDPKAIAQRITDYQNARQERLSNSDLYQFEYRKAYRDTVSITGILGLLHYNHSVEAFNRRDFKKAIAHLHHALLLHRSEKLVTFLDVMYTTILFDDSLQQEVKHNHLEKLRMLRTKKSARAGSVSMVPLVR